MTRRIAYKRVGWGFLVGVVLFSIGYWMDSEGMMTAAYFAGKAICALGVSNLAEVKGHKGGMYFVWTLFTTVLIGLIIVWLSANRAASTNANEEG